MLGVVGISVAMANLLRMPAFAGVSFIAALAMSSAARADDCDLKALFPEGAYRPLITFAPAKNGVLSLGMTMEVWPKDDGPAFLKIGDYNVTGAPVARLIPGKGVTAYVQHPFKNKICIVTDKLRSGAPTFLQEWAYAGGLMKLSQGGRLDVHFTSALPYATNAMNAPEASPNGGAPCQSSNLHTHGLLVRPTPGKENANGMAAEGLGDYVLRLAAPNPKDATDACKTSDKPKPDTSATRDHAHAHGGIYVSLDYAIRIPARKPGKGQDPTETGYHPSGLFWMHPHPHGYSAHQLRGGTTSLITIGKPGDYMKWQGEGQKDPKNIRHMILKDAQLEMISGIGANGAALWQFNNAWDPTLCANARRAMKGECDTSKDLKKWVFTVNGQQYPHLQQDVQQNESELWRIANASSNVTFRLTLQNKNDSNQRLKFQILAVDGVAVGDITSSTGKIAELQTQLLLMPGSRSEIGIPHKSGTWVLTQEAVDGNGDQWPKVYLAEIVWKDATPSAAAPIASAAPALDTATDKPLAVISGFTPRRTITPHAQKRTAQAPSATPMVCDLPAGYERVIMFVKKPPRPTVGKEAFALIAGMRPKGLTDINGMLFFKRSRDTNGQDVPIPAVDVIRGLLSVDENGRHLYTPVFGAADLGGEEYGDVCTYIGRDELWVLENWTDEIHNFHIHQTRFRIADQDNTAPLNAYFQWPSKVQDKPALTATDAAIQAFYDSKNIQGFAHHDSAPVPRGGDGCNGAPTIGPDGKVAGDCQPSRVTVLINFNRQEQIGTFPYHCHILEHEDLGMMALVTVKDAQASTSVSSAHRTHH